MKAARADSSAYWYNSILCSVGRRTESVQLCTLSAGKPWQAIGMGNKDSHKREVKKPKMKKLKPQAFSQAGARILKEAPKS
jgi:hypothetical protein